MQKIIAGVDIGGTNTVIGLVNADGTIITRDVISTQQHTDPVHFVNQVYAIIKKLCGSSFQIDGVGIGAPSGNYFSGAIEYAPNMPWKGIVPLADLFSQKLNCTVALTNDANAAALGEMLFGGAKGIKDFLFITLGTGLGSGIVVNGELIYGNDGNAGEIGHVIVERNGRLCGCGNRGCLETYCSATGIVTTYLQMKKISATENSITAKYIFQRATEGEKEAIHSFHYTADLLGLVLANSVAYTSPKTIFLFGGLAQAGDLLLKPTIKSFEKNLYPVYRGKVNITLSSLNENDAAILGAASLIFNKQKNAKQ
jgi:glucokinase